MGAFADLKSSYTRGHSAGVAELAAGAAERLGLAPEAVAEVRRAGYVHDVGRAGVSAGVWEKEGPLTDGEWEKVRMHAYYTERILARPPLLARLGTLGALDHERMDGTGYPHRHAAASLPAGARLLQAADMYQAMRETRPHRRSIAREEIAATLEKEAETGRLDREAVRAVLETAGHRDRARPHARHRQRRLSGRPDRSRGRGAAARVARPDRQGGRRRSWRSRRARWATTWRTPTRRSASPRARARRCSR